MSTRRFFWRWIAPQGMFALGLLSWVLVGYAIYYFESIDWRVNARNQMMAHLTGCPPDSARFACDGGGYFHARGYIDFRKGVFGSGGDDLCSAGITLTMGPGTVMETSMSRDKAEEFKRLLSSLPQENAHFWESYDFKRNLYVAFWKDQELQIYRYSRQHPPHEVIDFLQAVDPHLAENLAQ